MNLVEQYLRDMIVAFNKKAAEDPKLAKELGGVKRMVEIVVTDGECYHFLLDNAHVGDLQMGKATNPEISVAASKEIFDQLRSGELRPMKALALKKLKVHASLEDLLRLRKFF